MLYSQACLSSGIAAFQGKLPALRQASHPRDVETLSLTSDDGGEIISPCLHMVKKGEKEKKRSTRYTAIHIFMKQKPRCINYFPEKPDNWQTNNYSHFGIAEMLNIIYIHCVEITGTKGCYRDQTPPRGQKEDAREIRPHQGGGKKKTL